MMTGWVMTGWLSLEALETTGQVTQIHARLTASTTEKRNPAGQVEYGWSPARARRAATVTTAGKFTRNSAH